MAFGKGRGFSLPRRRVLVWTAAAMWGALALGTAAISLRTHQRMEASFRTPRGPVALPERLGPLEPVRFRAEDGVQLSGWYVPPRDGAVVVLVHGLEQGRLGLLQEARTLSEHGYGVLMFDLRGHGESGGETTLGDRERLDIRAALAFARARLEVHRLGALGFSVGAAALADVAASPAGADLPVVLQSPFSTREEGVRSDFRHYGWLSGTVALLSLSRRGIDIEGLQPIRSLQQLQHRPLLLMVGGAEPDAAMMGRVVAAAPAGAEVWRVAGATHGHYAEAAGPEYARRLLCFFEQALRDAPPCGPVRERPAPASVASSTGT